MNPTEPRCEVCGTGSDLAVLSRPGERGERGERAGSLRICRPCLAVREAASWPSNSPDGRRIAAALTDPAGPSGARFSYLRDEDEVVHLLRLRPGWVDRHAGAEAGKAPAA